MITMLNSILIIDIEECKHHLKGFETTPCYSVLALFCLLKQMPEHFSPDLYSSVELFVRRVFEISEKIPEIMLDGSQVFFLGIVKHPLRDFFWKTIT